MTSAAANPPPPYAELDEELLLGVGAHGSPPLQQQQPPSAILSQESELREFFVGADNLVSEVHTRVATWYGLWVWIFFLNTEWVWVWVFFWEVATLVHTP